MGGKVQSHAICLCLLDKNGCMFPLCPAITVRKMAISGRLTKQAAQQGICTLIKFVLYVLIHV